ncbi:hypothetical protein ANTPLA_LOCUS5997 [Anthophora plagiata]
MEKFQRCAEIRFIHELNTGRSRELRQTTTVGGTSVYSYISENNRDRLGGRGKDEVARGGGGDRNRVRDLRAKEADEVADAL